VRLPKRRSWRLLAALLALTLTAAACGSDKKTNAATPTKNPVYDGLTGTITGTGASFPDAFYQSAVEAFGKVATGLKVNYNPTGSGQGKKDYVAGLNDFAGSDSLAKEADVPNATFYYVPTVGAPITVSYNLSAVAKLQLSPNTLAGIFQGTIKSWDDAAIKADNPGVTLPATKIVIVHRSDGSGTTNNFTSYLKKAATAWTLGAGDTVAWPTDSQAGTKNTGVAQAISSTPGAIGYVDLSDATLSKLVFAAIKNKSGSFVTPTLDAASAALAGATVNSDLSYDPLDASGATAYPITSPTYLLLHRSYADAAKGKAVVGFVTYLLNEGQALAKDANFAKLPDSLLSQAKAQLAKVTY
jgi:phosphate transport system substrate-binding protein